VPVPGGNPNQGSPSPAVSPSSLPAVQQQPVPYSEGSCLSGNFSGSTPKDVNGAPCSSSEAEYRIVKEFPDATDPSVCEGVPGAKFGYLEEYTENGIPVESYVYCLGQN
jgi:hypothetical protein